MMAIDFLLTWLYLSIHRKTNRYNKQLTIYSTSVAMILFSETVFKTAIDARLTSFNTRYDRKYINFVIKTKFLSKGKGINSAIGG